MEGASPFVSDRVNLSLKFDIRIDHRKLTNTVGEDFSPLYQTSTMNLYPNYVERFRFCIEQVDWDWIHTN